MNKVAYNLGYKLAGINLSDLLKKGKDFLAKSTAEINARKALGTMPKSVKPESKLYVQSLLEKVLPEIPKPTPIPADSLDEMGKDLLGYLTLKSS